MNKTVFTLFDLKILEPATFISDISLGIACYLFYRYIHNIAESKTHRYYALYFLFMSLSGFIGGFAHSLFLYTGKPLQYFGWLMSGIAIYFIEIGVISNVLDEKKKNFLVQFIRIRFFIIYILTAIYMNFLFVKINIAFGSLIVVSPFMLFQYFKYRLRYNLYIVGSIFLAILPAIFHKMKVNFGGCLDMNDFSHYFLIICFFIMFLGLKGLIETETKTQSKEI
jgi:hypothetical protein